MEKSASDPFARPPALSTRSASSSGPLEEDSHQAAPKAESWAFGKSLTTSSTTTTSTNPPKLQSDSAAIRQVPDMYSPPVFNGAFPDPEKWLAHFSRYIQYRCLNAEEQLALFPLFLKDSAIDWYDNLQDNVKKNLVELLDQFRAYFCPSPLDHILDKESVFTRTQRPSERARDYIAAMQKLARRLPGLDVGILKCVILRGLQPHIKAFVVQQKVETIGDMMEAARVAESIGVTSTVAAGGEVSELMNDVRSELRHLSSRVDRLTTSSVSSRSPSPERRSAGRRVSFAEQRSEQQSESPRSFYIPSTEINVRGSTTPTEQSLCVV